MVEPAPPNKHQHQHFSKDCNKFPFFLLCLLCKEDTGRSRYFSTPRSLFFHLYKIHKKSTGEFLVPESESFEKNDKRIKTELENLEILSKLNQMGAFVR